MVDRSGSSLLTVKPYVQDGNEGRHGRRITNRTAQLPKASRILYKIEHYTSLPAIALIVTAVVVCLVATITALSFPGTWVDGFEVFASAATVVMVFAIQHTQGREQAATQRKLDELIRALPNANESLMMLEEASQEVMLKVEDDQRDIRSVPPDNVRE
jgi:low affinity Fe/Cu permease